MNYSVDLMIILLDSKGNLLSTYKVIKTNSSLERFGRRYESKVACMRLRRLFVCNAEGNVPRPKRHHLGHIGFNMCH